jgi:transforming growth factor-beta-induced protein
MNLQIVTSALLSASLITALGCGSSAPAPASADGASTPAAEATETSAEAPAEKDIVDTAVAAGSFDTLVAAVQAADLVEVLKGEGPFTVFAPTDEAFAKLPGGTVEDLLKPENKAKLQTILKHHVVSGKVMSSDVAGLKSAKTVENTELSIDASGGSVKIDDATVVTADIGCSNGVIHVIDTVMLP